MAVMKKNILFALGISIIWVVIFAVSFHYYKKDVYEKYVFEDSGEFRVADASWVHVPEKDAPETWEVVVDEKLALQIANEVFKRDMGENFLKQTRYRVYEVPESQIYIVIRNIGEGAGGDYCVAIRKTDGAIVRAWIGE